MIFQGFRKVEATNPNTGEVVQKIRVYDDEGFEYTLLTDRSAEDIKKNRDDVLSRLVKTETQYGTCVRERRSTVLEEF